MNAQPEPKSELPKHAALPRLVTWLQGPGSRSFNVTTSIASMSGETMETLSGPRSRIDWYEHRPSDSYASRLVAGQPHLRLEATAGPHNQETECRNGSPQD